jgi:radical SAM superfamily enzyme YgiQ (UPF0313 family)
MKLLLVAPPIFDFYFTPGRAEPLGLFYLKAAVHHYCPDITVDLYNARSSGKKREMQPPSCFDHLKDVYVQDQSVFGLMSKYQRFGDSLQKIAAKVQEGGYDVVGISSLFTGYHPDVEDLIAAVKKQCGALIVVGGWAVAADAARLLSSSQADFLVTGGEESCCWLLQKLAQGTEPRSLPRLIGKQEGEELASENSFFLEGYPQRTQQHYRRGQKIASVTLSRGCALKCGFCAIHRYQTYCCRPLTNIDRELASLEKAQVEIVDFEDDHLFDKRRMPEALLELFTSYGQRGMRYMAMNGITAPHLRPYTQKALNAGFVEFNLSLVTSQANVARAVERPVFLGAIEDIARQSIGRAAVVVYMILGLPGQTLHSALQDILTLAALPVVVGVSPLYLLPGIPLFEQLGVADERRLSRGSALYKFSGDLQRSDVIALWKLVRLINAVKTSEVPDEQLYYFKRALKERRWYHLTAQGWSKGSLAIPALDLSEPMRIQRPDGSLSFLKLP